MARLSTTPEAILEPPAEADPEEQTTPAPRRARAKALAPDPERRKWYYRVRGATSIVVGPTGHYHDTLDDDGRLVVQCAECEPHLEALNFSTKPRDVELTYDEIQDREQANADERALSAQMARALAESGRQMLMEQRAKRA